MDVREKLKHFLKRKAQDLVDEITVASKRTTDDGCDSEIIEGTCAPTAGNAQFTE